LFQRPQHIAKELAKLGVSYFYHTTNSYDSVFGVREIDENLFLIESFDAAYNYLSGKKKYIHVYSTNINEQDTERINRALANGDTILYEYIDEISEKISGKPIPPSIQKRHTMLLQNEDQCIVIATATALFEQVATFRTKNFCLVTNGVRIEDFGRAEKTVPAEISRVVALNKPIIGYYGAFASWFDYQLLEAVAKQKPEWEFLLIGWDYDGTLAKSNLPALANVTVLGPVPYSMLSKYAQWFTVCTIPFLINEVTNATSPVKVFEYMAMGKPIVTTPLPECKKYSQVIISNTDSDSFISGIASGLRLADNQAYQEAVQGVAAQNTWRMKSMELLKCLESDGS
jgi:glycosyltransferase involved in cell wall biosynthesis